MQIIFLTWKNLSAIWQILCILQWLDHWLFGEYKDSQCCYTVWVIWIYCCSGHPYICLVMIAWVGECCFCRYDSVTVDGRLEYQNQLNDNNKPFFDICDGIFINYAWNVILYLHLILPREAHSVCVTNICIVLSRKISCRSQQLLLITGNMTFTWELMFLEGALLVVDNGMYVMSYGILNSLLYEYKYIYIPFKLWL